MITDRQGLITWANPAFSLLTGYSLEEAVGRTPGALLKSGQHEPAFYRQLWETILAGEVWQGNISNRAEDGHLYQEEMTITPVRNDNGEISHFIAIKQDITSRIEAEQEILRQAGRAEALTRTAARLNALHDLPSVIQAVCEETAQALPVETVSLILAKVPGKYPASITGVGMPFYPTPAMAEALGLLPDTLTSLDMVEIKIPDAQMRDLYEQYGLPAGAQPCWIARAAMVREGEAIGSLNAIGFGDAPLLTAHHQAIIRGLADQAAQAIANARLLQDARQRASQLELLYEAGLKMNSLSDFHQPERDAVPVCDEHLECQRGILF